MSIEQIKLINYNNPKCLYCKAICDLSISQKDDDIEFTAYDCKSCGDFFIISLIGGNVELQFTCKEFNLFYINDDSVYEMYNTEHGDYRNRISIPIFDIDFSDREKLHNKLKTYLTFS